VDANGFIDPVGMQSLNFTISNTNYEAASPYNINSYLYLPVSDADTELNFGDEFYFYGEIQTDIEATIYEMRYLINLPNNQFVNSSNPTWVTDYTPYMSEIGLYDSDKNLLVLSKFQSPQIREGIQQVAVKLDF
jgi:glycine cleavage system pyridoxal-binding protein P